MDQERNTSDAERHIAVGVGNTEPIALKRLQPLPLVLPRPCLTPAPSSLSTSTRAFIYPRWFEDRRTALPRCNDVTLYMFDISFPIRCYTDKIKWFTVKIYIIVKV